MLKWVFSLLFPDFHVFRRERKSLVNFEVFLGKNSKTKERKDRGVADCMDSSPPLILSEISGRNLGEFDEMWETFGKIQGNSVGFCMALNANSVGVPDNISGKSLQIGIGEIGGVATTQSASLISSVGPEKCSSSRQDRLTN